MSLNAYQRARTITETPRHAECRLIREITGEMIAARDAGVAGVALMPVLARNRDMWHVFQTDCSSPGNGLPAPVRAGIISLALWVSRYTSEVVTGKDDIGALIDVNRMMIEGLEGTVH